MRYSEARKINNEASVEHRRKGEMFVMEVFQCGKIAVNVLKKIAVNLQYLDLQNLAQICTYLDGKTTENAMENKVSTGVLQEHENNEL